MPLKPRVPSTDVQMLLLILQLYATFLQAGGRTHGPWCLLCTAVPAHKNFDVHKHLFVKHRLRTQLQAAAGAPGGRNACAAVPSISKELQRLEGEEPHTRSLLIPMGLHKPISAALSNDSTCTETLVNLGCLYSSSMASGRPCKALESTSGQGFRFWAAIRTCVNRAPDAACCRPACHIGSTSFATISSLLG